MKKISTIIAICAALISVFAAFSFKSETSAPSYEYEVFTTIESVVPMGIGRSRMISTNEKGVMEEAKMKNFFSATGINFSNVRENDSNITNKISAMTAKGWQLQDVTSGVYSNDGKGGGTGIFITRYLFRKQK